MRRHAYTCTYETPAQKLAKIVLRCSDDGAVLDSEEDFNIDRDDFAPAEENDAIRRSILVPSL